MQWQITDFTDYTDRERVRGSMSCPEVSAPHRPACRGGLTVEADIPAGKRMPQPLAITAWQRPGEGGVFWVCAAARPDEDLGEFHEQQTE